MWELSCGRRAISGGDGSAGPYCLCRGAHGRGASADKRVGAVDEETQAQAAQKEATMSDINSDNGDNSEGGGELAGEPGAPFSEGQWRAAYQGAETDAQRIALVMGYMVGEVPPVEDVQAALDLLGAGELATDDGDHQAVMEGAAGAQLEPPPAAPAAPVVMVLNVGLNGGLNSYGGR